MVILKDNKKVLAPLRIKKDDTYETLRTLGLYEAPIHTAETDAGSQGHYSHTGIVFTDNKFKFAVQYINGIEAGYFDMLVAQGYTDEQTIKNKMYEQYDTDTNYRYWEVYQSTDGVNWSVDTTLTLIQRRNKFNELGSLYYSSTYETAIDDTFVRYIITSNDNWIGYDTNDGEHFYFSFAPEEGQSHTWIDMGCYDDYYEPDEEIENLYYLSSYDDEDWTCDTIAYGNNKLVCGNWVDDAYYIKVITNPTATVAGNYRTELGFKKYYTLKLSNGKRYI